MESNGGEAAMSAAWSLPRRVAFRFGFIAGALYVYPFPLGMIPKTETLGEWAGKPWQALVVWFAEAVVGLDRPSTEETGSGDTMYGWMSMLVMLVLATLGAAAWSALDRKRAAYPRLEAAALVVLRYVLAITMLSYGVAKVWKSQFPDLDAARLDEPIGEMSPMGLLWTFMGHSTPYTVFGGLAECLGGVLLLWRRTTLAGALVVIAVMTNVFLLNMSYDVPVKLYSAQLLVMAGLIALPHARRLVLVVLGYAAPAAPARAARSRRWERGRLVAKVVALAVTVYAMVDQIQTQAGFHAPATELDGIWVVEVWSADGAEHPPLLTDAVRWRKLLVNGRRVAIRLMSDERTRLPAEIDEGARTITVHDDQLELLWHYTRTDETHLAIDGTFRGKALHVTFVREPDGLLETRGFHWVQQVPFNR